MKETHKDSKYSSHDGAGNLIANLEYHLKQFEETSSLSDLQAALIKLQPQIKPYFSSLLPQKIIQSHTKELSRRLRSNHPSNDNLKRATQATLSNKLKHSYHQHNVEYDDRDSGMDDEDDDDSEETEQSDGSEESEDRKYTQIASELLEDATASKNEKSNISNGSTLESLGFGSPENVELLYREALWKDKINNIKQLIIEHLYREGMVEEAEKLQTETQIEVDSNIKYQFNDMREILESLKRREFDTTLRWCHKELDRLHHVAEMVDEDEAKIQNPPEAVIKKLTDEKKLETKIENLMFRLYRIRYVQMLKQHGSDEDIAKVVHFARENLGPFSKKKEFMEEIRVLMGAFLYANHLQDSPYAYLTKIDSENEWEEIIQLFKDISCIKLDKPKHSPLHVTALAGQIALPLLLKQAYLLKSTMNKEEWENFHNADQLTIRIPLGEEFHFHNIFTCPVSHEIATPENPAILLPCGHVLCKNSVDRIAPARGSIRKCPYCRSTEFLKTKCQELNFG